MAKCSCIIIIIITIIIFVSHTQDAAPSIQYLWLQDLSHDIQIVLNPFVMYKTTFWNQGEFQIIVYWGGKTTKVGFC